MIRSKKPFEISYDALPDTLPVFPLAGAVMLPGSPLPLNIFEPRYLNLCLDALKEQRLIGMVQPRAEGSTLLYDTGCAGRISSFTETDEARMMIVLTGVCRFHLKEEIPTIRGYRCFQVDWGTFVEDMEPGHEVAFDRSTFKRRISTLLAQENQAVDWGQADQLPDSVLIDFMSTALPLEPQEKQLLLEATDHADRADKLSKLLQIHLAEVEHYPTQ